VPTQRGEPEIRNGRLDNNSTPPTEASSFSGATPSVWKEESSVFMRQKSRISKAAQGEAEPVVLRRKTPEAQGLLLVEREGVLRRNLPEAHDAGSAHPCNGRVKSVAATEEHAKSAKNKTNNRVRLGSIPCPEI